jgi:hypothetical protein
LDRVERINHEKASLNRLALSGSLCRSARPADDRFPGPKASNAVDPPVDGLPREIRRGEQVPAEWDFQVIDVELAMIDLVNLVRAQTTTWEGS